jgi:hypothetical protein
MFDINTLKDIKLNPGQFAWMMSLNYLNVKNWSKGYNGFYQESTQLRIQVVIHDEGFVQISTWDVI